MLRMSDKPKEYTAKIPGRSVPEVFARFDNELTRQASTRGVKFSGGKNLRKLPAEVLTNLVMLHFLDLPEEQRDAIVDRYLPGYDAMMAGQEGKGAALSPGTFYPAERIKPPEPRKKRG